PSRDRPVRAVGHGPAGGLSGTPSAASPTGIETASWRTQPNPLRNTPMRTRRATLILTALTALLCGPAAAPAVDIFDTIKWKELTEVKPVGDSSANPVFVVRDGTKYAYIAKFSTDVPLTINFADRFLKGRITNVPESLSLPVTEKRAQTAKKAILDKVQDQ